MYAGRLGVGRGVDGGLKSVGLDALEPSRQVKRTQRAPPTLGAATSLAQSSKPLPQQPGVTRLETGINGYTHFFPIQRPPQ